MKNILKHIAPFSMINTLSGINKKTWKNIGYNILLILTPLIFVTSIMFLGCVVGSFLLWKLPENYYFPFVTGGYVQHMFDRLLLGIGIIISLCK